MVTDDSVNLMRFNKAKCNVLHVSQDNPRYQYKLGDDRIESIPDKKDFRVLVNEKLGMSHQCALAAQKAKHILGCIKRSVASKSREVILHLYSGETSLGILHSALEPQHKKDMDLLDMGPEESHKDDLRAGAPLL